MTSYFPFPGSDGTGGSSEDLAPLKTRLSSVEGKVRTLEETGGQPGDPGASAYEIAVANGYVGSEAAWLASLVGRPGDPGVGTKGDDGFSAFEIAVLEGFQGDEAAWLASLVGRPGDPGVGTKGDTGLSAYQLAVENGFVGSLDDWIDSLVGAPGSPGPSAYQVAVANGFVGTVAQWLASLKGEPGEPGGGGDGSGAPGKSAYQLAVENGFVGTVSEWLDSLKGEPGVGAKGDEGDDAYAVAVRNGFPGTEAEWLASLVGAPGVGLKGDQGASAYQTALDNGFVGTEADWLASLHGLDGRSAYAVAVSNGFVGSQVEWLASLKGAAGQSAYQVAVANGFVGDQAAWLASLHGAVGKSAFQVAVDGGYAGAQAQWLASLKGADGKSAYQIAVDGGYAGTAAQWIASLKGIDGKSAYQIAVAAGYAGTEAEWLASLRGQKGDNATIVGVLPGGARIRHSATQKYSVIGSWNTVRFDTIDFDTDGFWTSSNPNRLTIPAGVRKVRLTASMSVATSDTIAVNEFTFSKNGVRGISGIGKGTIDAGGTTTPGLVLTTAVLDVVQGDYFEFSYLIDSSFDTASGASSSIGPWFAIEIVERTGAGTGISMSVRSLQDVVAPNPKTGETLVYDSITGTWKPGLPLVTANQVTGLNKPFKGAMSRFDAAKNFTSPFQAQWDSIDYDTAAFWSAAAPAKMTVPKGIKRVRLHACIAPEAASFDGNFTIQFHRNGAAFRGGSLSGASGASGRNFGASIVSPPISVVEGDFFEVRVTFASATASIAMSALHSFFAIEAVETTDILT